MGFWNWLFPDSVEEKNKRSEQRLREEQHRTDQRLREEQQRADQRLAEEQKRNELKLAEEQKRNELKLAERKQQFAEEEAKFKHCLEAMEVFEQNKLDNRKLSHLQHNDRARTMQDTQNTRIRFILVGIFGMALVMLPVCYFYPDSTESKAVLALIVGSFIFFLWYVLQQDKQTVELQQRQEKVEFAIEYQNAANSQMAVTGAQNTFTPSTLMQLKYD